MMNPDLKLLHQLEIVNEERIKMLLDDFFDELLQAMLSKGATFDMPERSEYFTDTPKHIWTAEMHVIYGRAMELYRINEYLSTHLYGTNPDSFWNPKLPSLKS